MRCSGLIFSRWQPQNNCIRNQPQRPPGLGQTPTFPEIACYQKRPSEDDDFGILDFFRSHNDPSVFMERLAMRRAEFRELISPLVRSGHLVQDYRGGFKTVEPMRGDDLWSIKRQYLRELVEDYPVMDETVRKAGWNTFFS